MQNQNQNLKSMKKYQLTPIPLHSEQWYKFRENGTGASEIGIILGESYYSNKMFVFHAKCGTQEQSFTDSERMFFGRVNEALIGNLWKCWDGTTEGYVNNYNNYMSEVAKLQYEDIMLLNIEDVNAAINKLTKANDFIIRKNKRVNAYITHPDYPYLFCSLDFMAEKDSFLLTDINHPKLVANAGEVIGEFPIETKTIDKFAAQQFVFDVPNSYVAQLNTQMLLTDSYYGELAILVGGNHLIVRGYERSDLLCNNIITENTKFWEERILPAKEFYRKYKETGKEEYLAEVYALEPPPDDNPDYKGYLSDRHIKEFDTIQGNKEMEAIVQDAVYYDEIHKGIGKILTGKKNSVVYLFCKNKCSEIDFGSNGKVRYYVKGNNKNHELNLRGYKNRPDGDTIEAIINGIKTNGNK